MMQTVFSGCVNVYCRYYFNSPLGFKELYREGDFWVFSEPNLYHNGAQLSAEKFLCSVSVQPWKRVLELKLVVDSSQIDLRHKVSDIQRTLQEIVSRSVPYWLFKLRLEFTIPQGRISWCHHENKIDASALFRLHAISDTEHSCAELELFLDENNPIENRLLIVFDQKPKGSREANLIFSQVDCAKLFTVSRSVGCDLHAWEVDGGLLNGHCSLKSHKDKTFSAQVQAALKKFDYSNAKIQLSGHFDEVVFDFDAMGLKKGIPHLKGQLQAASGYLLDKKPSGSRWKMSEFSVALEALAENQLRVASQGNGFYGDHPFGVKISGEVYPFTEKDPQAFLNCLLSQPAKEDAEIRLCFKNPFSLYPALELNFERIKKEDVGLFQTIFFADAYSDTKKLEMQRGQLEGKMTFSFEQGQLSQIELHEIFGEDLVFMYPLEKLYWGLDRILGTFSVDFRGDNPLETLEGSAELHQTKIEFPGMNDQTWHLYTDKADLHVENGILQNTEIRGSFEELEGIVAIDWKRDKEALKIDLTGPAEAAAKFMPESLRSRVDQVFSGQKIHLSGSVARARKEAHFTGQIDLIDKTVLASIQLGFSLQKASEEFWNKWPADPLAVAFWEDVGQEALKVFVPPVLAPTILFESNWIQSQAGLEGFVIRDGWFKTSPLSLKTYISPFLFRYDEAVLAGEGQFEGVFDHEDINVSYEAKNISLENPFLLMRVDAIKKSASHYFDLKRGTHYGMLPIQGATYLEKSSGLFFDSVDSLVIFERSNVHFSRLIARCHGMEACGSVDVDFGLPHDDIFAVEIYANQVKGKLGQLQEILLRLDPDIPFVHSALEGEIAIKEEGARLSLSFAGQSLEFDAQVKGEIANMRGLIPDSDAKLEKGKLCFDYDHRQKSLKLEDLSVELILPSHSELEKYTCVGNYVHFLDYTKGTALFDISIKDRNRDIIHLVGHSNTQENRTIFHFEPDFTHIDGIKPQSLSLVLNDSSSVEKFAIESDFKLNSLLKTGQILRRSRLFLQDLPLDEALKTFHTVNGAVHAQLAFEGNQGAWSWSLFGNKMGINNFSIEKASFQGSNKGEKWVLDELRFDQFSLSGAGIFRNGDWYFDRMTITYGDHLNANLSMDYLASERVAKVYFERMNVDLSPFLASISSGKKDLSETSVHGILSVNGTLEYSLSKNGSSGYSEAVLSGAIKSWGIAGVLFKDVEEINCRFSSDQGITIESLKTEILEPETRNSRGAYQLDRLTYDPATGACSLKNFAFQIPSHHLPWVSERLHRDFPELLTKDLAEVFGCCKLRGNFEGMLQYDYTAPYTGLQLRLKDGTYTFLNADHEVKQFVLEYDPFEFRIESKYKFGNDFVWLHARSTSPNLSEGALVLTDVSPEEYSLAKERPGIHILWNNHPLYGASIRTIEGNLYGLDFEMKRDPLEPLSEKAMYLTGSVSIDGSKTNALLPPQIAQKMTDWKVGQGYVICGKWQLSKSGSNDYEEQIFFKGLLEGKECEFKGCRFASLTAQLEYTPRAATFRELLLDDPCGTLKIGRIALTKAKDNWYFSIPEARIEKFKPALLRSTTDSPSQSNKSLVVSEGVLKGCQGRLDDIDSFTGGGEFRFLNKQKRRIPNGLFQIPADLMSRLGLDPTLMTPVFGTVEYRLSEGEIQLVKFKDMYSESKLSKFYLVPSYRSRVDFDGNLDIQVGMKQYNLLFKFAELCTIGIKGDLEKPAYSLQRHSDRSSKR